MKGFLAVLVMALTMPFAAQAVEDTTVLKAELQAAMQRHIDRSSIDGALPYMNLDTGEIEPLYPTEAHPLILEMAGGFIMCADLRTSAGEKRLVDFYVAPSGKRFKIIRTEVDNRAPLKALMSAGKAKRLK
ncbi:MAG: hypothetical protein AAF401_11395 [Pseudomonadota bacterium]